MTRTLHNSLMALSIAGLLLVLGLVAASPLPAHSTRLLPSVADATSAGTPATDGATTAHAGQALALGAALVAVVATEAALSAAFPDADAHARGEAAAAPAARKGSRPQRRSARSTIALPYFSFARGLRRGNGA